MKAFEFTYSGQADLKPFLEDVKSCENEVWDGTGRPAVLEIHIVSVHPDVAFRTSGKSVGGESERRGSA